MTPDSIELVFKSMILDIVFIDWLSLYAKDDLFKHKMLSYDLAATVGEHVPALQRKVRIREKGGGCNCCCIS